MWRELENFTDVVLKDHGHLSAVMAGNPELVSF
jgi:hypothetical protein